MQDLIDGDTTLSAFASALDNATQGFEQVSGSISDASNDITSPFPGFFTIDEIPHMVHFDHVDYFGYDDFASPTQLNSGIQFAASSETSLIGEFRIDENSSGEWSFDADLSVWLNNLDRSGKYQEVQIADP